MITYKTDDGYELRVFSSMYVDWGLEITKDGHELYYNPSCLNSESYGIHWEDEEENMLEEGIPWSEGEWLACLKVEADDFIEAYVPEMEVSHD